MPGWNVQVAGGVASYEAYCQTMPPWCREEHVIWDRRWMYQRRSPDTIPQWDQTFIATGAWWPMIKSAGFSGDPASPVFFSEETNGFMAGAFAAWEYGLGGNNGRKYIMGQCKNSAGDAFPARVYAYRTADGAYMGFADSQADGYYMVGIPNYTVGDTFFITAYAAGSPPYWGVTVNTLVPVNSDGT